MEKILEWCGLFAQLNIFKVLRRISTEGDIWRKKCNRDKGPRTTYNGVNHDQEVKDGQAVLLGGRMVSC